MGIGSIVNSTGDKLHGMLSRNLTIQDQGQYNGEWILCPTTYYFKNKTNIETSIFKEDIEITREFPISDFKAIEILTSTKDTGSIAKAALSGGAVGGVVGAIAGGLFAASKDDHFAKITLLNDQELHGHISQVGYETFVSRPSTDEQQFSGIIKTRVGGGDNAPAIAFAASCAFVLVIFIFQKILSSM